MNNESIKSIFQIMLSDEGVVLEVKNLPIDCHYDNVSGMYKSKCQVLSMEIVAESQSKTNLLQKSNSIIADRLVDAFTNGYLENVFQGWEQSITQASKELDTTEWTGFVSSFGVVVAKPMEVASAVKS